MEQQPPRLANALLILGLATLVIGGLGLLLWTAARVQFKERNPNGLSDRFQYDIDKYKSVDPALIGYEQTAEFATGLMQVRAIAVGPEDRLYVAGQKQIRVLRSDGSLDHEIDLEEQPTSVAVAGADLPTPGLIYVGLVHQDEAAPEQDKPPRSRARVAVYRADGSPLATWDAVEKGLFTSVAVADKGVFVADAGNRAVYHCDFDGKRLATIDGRDEANEEDPGPGFIIPSPYFDLAMAADGLLRVVNPGLHRIEAYTLDGHREFFWGEAGLQIERFCGCCNPAHIALLSDGRCVTAEKGVPRVKVYSPDGYFQCVVAGPELLAPTTTAIEETRTEHKLTAVDVGVDSRGRLLVLDPAALVVRVFEPKPKDAEQPANELQE